MFDVSVGAGESWCNWVIRLREADCPVGTVQATVTGDERGAVAEVAWVVGAPWQGRGIAMEAARGLVAWLGRLPAHTMVAHVHPAHVASAAVAAAAGLAPTERSEEGEVEWRSVAG